MLWSAAHLAARAHAKQRGVGSGGPALAALLVQAAAPHAPQRLRLRLRSSGHAVRSLGSRVRP